MNIPHHPDRAAESASRGLGSPVRCAHAPASVPADTPTDGILRAPTDKELDQRFTPIFERIREGTVQREQSRELAFEAVRWLREANFGALRVPQSYGGIGASLPQLFRLLVALGEADSNLPQILRAHFAFVEGRLNAQDDKTRDIWLPRVVDGALFGAAMAERTAATETTVTLERRDDHWWLNGRKFYCTGTIYSSWIVAAARDGDDRVSVAVPVSAAGVKIVDDWDGFGQRLTGSGTTEFDNVRLEDENIIRRFPPKLPHSDSYITAFYQTFHLAALSGIARAILRDGVAFVQAKTRAFGVPGLSSPREDPLVQRVIGRLGSLAFAAQTLTEGVARAMQEVFDAHLAGHATPAQYASVDIKTFEAQQIVINHVLEAATLLFEVGGASAVSETRRLDRHWRNARTLASHNPAIFRERAIGDYYLNGTVPDAAWKEALEKSVHGADAASSPDDDNAASDKFSVAETSFEAAIVSEVPHE
jgi:alkylation response protein AidB-like acyl-CoA dehydrogenase